LIVKCSYVKYDSESVNFLIFFNFLYLTNVWYREPEGEKGQLVIKKNQNTPRDFNIASFFIFRQVLEKVYEFFMKLIRIGQLI